MYRPTNPRIESLVTHLVDGQLISDDGKIKEVESLLSQLRNGVNNGLDSSSGGRGHSHPGSRPPVALNALTILDEIERDALYLLPGHYPSLEARVLSILDRLPEVGESRAVKWLDKVVSRIEGLFRPPKMVEILRPCPICGVMQTHRTNDDGEVRRLFALQAWVDADDEAHAQCFSCFASWSGFEEVASLSRTLTVQSA